MIVIRTLSCLILHLFLDRIELSFSVQFISKMIETWVVSNILYAHTYRWFTRIVAYLKNTYEGDESYAIYCHVTVLTNFKFDIAGQKNLYVHLIQAKKRLVSFAGETPRTKRPMTQRICQNAFYSYRQLLKINHMCTSYMYV